MKTLLALICISFLGTGCSHKPRPSIPQIEEKIDASAIIEEENIKKKEAHLSIMHTQARNLLDVEFKKMSKNTHPIVNTKDETRFDKILASYEGSK